MIPRGDADHAIMPSPFLQCTNGQEDNLWLWIHKQSRYPFYDRGFWPSTPKRPEINNATQRDGALGKKEQGDRKGDAERNSVPFPPKLC